MNPSKKLNQFHFFLNAPRSLAQLQIPTTNLILFRSVVDSSVSTKSLSISSIGHFIIILPEFWNHRTWIFTHFWMQDYLSKFCTNEIHFMKITKQVLMAIFMVSPLCVVYYEKQP